MTIYSYQTSNKQLKRPHKK